MTGSRRGTHVLDGVCTGAILSRRQRNRRMHALNGNVDKGSKPLKVIEPTSTAGDGATTNSTASGATTEEHGMCLRPRDGEDRAQPEKRRSAAQAACDRRVQRQHQATQQRRRAAEGAARDRESMHTDEPLGDGTEPQALCQREKRSRPRDDPRPVHHVPDSTSQSSSALARENAHHARTRAKTARERDGQASQSESDDGDGAEDGADDEEAPLSDERVQANAAAASTFLGDDSVLSACQPCGAPASEADASAIAGVAVPVPVPHGYVLAAPPLEATLRLDSPDLDWSHAFSSLPCVCLAPPSGVLVSLLG